MSLILRHCHYGKKSPNEEAPVIVMAARNQPRQNYPDLAFRLPSVIRGLLRQERRADATRKSKTYAQSTEHKVNI